MVIRAIIEDEGSHHIVNRGVVIKISLKINV